MQKWAAVRELPCTDSSVTVTHGADSSYSPKQQPRFYTDVTVQKILSSHAV